MRKVLIFLTQDFPSMSKVTKIIYFYADGTYLPLVPSVFSQFPVSEFHATDYYEIMEYEEDEMVQQEFDF